MKLRLKRDEPGAAERTVAMGRLAEVEMASGRCCAEAMVLAAVEHLNPSATPMPAASLAGLCGGMGGRRATCGVYTGGALALGVALEGAPSKVVKRASARLLERLEAESGALVCGELLARMGPENSDYSLCRRLAARGAELVEEIAEPLMDEDPDP